MNKKSNGLKLFRIVLIFILYFFNLSPVFSQEIRVLPKEMQENVERYKELVARYKQANNPQQEAFYLNKIAFIYWGNGNAKEAINYFLQTVPLNERVGNYADIKAVYSNIALIYSDMDRLDLTL
ncbi:MAG TPA: hypothetical protein P5349_05815, partial [Tenuifilaceae bacterium]|nr:hypothetical protein [Tenuifilaceae bacterium]